MADFNIDNLMKECINEVIKNKPNSDIETTWFSLTRQMFHNYPAVLVYARVDEALAQASDEDQKWLKLPEVKVSRELKIDKTANKLKDRITMIGLADKFGLKPLGREMRICPFHNDTQASLGVSNGMGVFHCFGCGIKGDIITFYKKLRELNEKRRS